MIGQEYKILRNPTICTRSNGKKCCHFIYLMKDEVVDTVLKQSHDSHQALTSKTRTSKI
jgi:hypothetical protein